MSTRTALFLTSAVLIAAASPALAQDNRYGVHPDADTAIEWEQREVVQEWREDDYSGDATRGEHHARREIRRHRPMQHEASAPRLAYSQDEREAWLADCRIVMRGDDYYNEAEYENDDRGNGGLLGGLLGAVVGGVAGNRIGGSGDRLLGTVIGAGVGGIAGAVIGDAIDGGDDDSDRRDYRDRDGDYAANYCDAYLRRYEASGSTGQMAHAAVQPVMLVATPARHGGMRETITEEWIDVPAEHVVRTRRRSAPRRVVPEPGKLTRTD